MSGEHIRGIPRTYEKEITLADTPYTLSVGFNCVKVDTTGGNVRVNLPNVNYPIDVIKTSSDSYIVTVWVGGVQKATVAGELSKITIENAEVTQDEPWYPYDAIVGIAGVSGDGGEVLAKDRYGRVISGGRGVAGTDDASVIQAAVNVSDDIYLNSGEFNINSTVSYIKPDYGRGKYIHGAGNSTRLIPNADICFLINPQGDATNHIYGDRISNLRFDGYATENTGYVCIQRENAHITKTDNISFFRIKGQALNHLGSWGSDVSHCWFLLAGMATGLNFGTAKFGEHCTAIILDDFYVERWDTVTGYPMIALDHLCIDTHISNFFTEGFCPFLYYPNTSSYEQLLSITNGIVAIYNTVAIDVGYCDLSHITHFGTSERNTGTLLRLTGVNGKSSVSDIKGRYNTDLVLFDGCTAGNLDIDNIRISNYVRLLHMYDGESMRVNLTNFGTSDCASVIGKSGLGRYIIYHVQNGDTYGSYGHIFDVSNSFIATIQNVVNIYTNWGLDNYYNFINANNMSPFTLRVFNLYFGGSQSANKCKYAIYTGNVAQIVENCSFDTNHPLGRGTDSAGSHIRSNVGYIASGESRSAFGRLTAGVADAIAFAWHNPELQDILIKKITIRITTPGGTAGSLLDVGIADDVVGTNLGTEFFNDIDLNTAAIVKSTVSPPGTQTVEVFCQDSISVTDGWIVGKILVANAAALVGSYYIEYEGA